MRALTEALDSGPVPHLRVAEWSRYSSWLVHGITIRRSPPGGPGTDAGGEGVGAGGTEDGGEWDFGFGGSSSPARPLSKWERLRTATGADLVVRSPQPHGAAVRVARGGTPGLHFSLPCDGHLTADPGVLVTVTIADCVPVLMLAPERPAVGVLHAGWRGIAAGIVEAGVRAFRDRFAVSSGGLHLHFGPAISGSVYEVGGEVHRALSLPDPGGPATVDLRTVAAERAARAGVAPERISRSTRCTREDPDLFSHRSGDRGRQVAFLGILPL